jgi:(5R)-carbapenem-3-carboxylate synthase
MTTTYPPLTPSGKGALITERRVTDLSVDETRELIARHQWLVFKDNPVSLTEVEGFLRQFGTLVENDRRRGAVLELDASKKDEGEVLLGQGFLPLHRDGALMGYDIELVGIYCVLHKNVTGGRTFVTDIENGCTEIPQDILDLIRERGIEGRPVDRYYLKGADTWHKIAGFIEVNGKSYLNVGFPSPPGEKPSWLLRIPGVDDDRCQEIFEIMGRVLMSDRYCYYHVWNEGDLILLDNRRLLHGREAFRGERARAQLQGSAA